jgi:hypothetical protein
MKLLRGIALLAIEFAESFLHMVREKLESEKADELIEASRKQSEDYAATFDSLDPITDEARAMTATGAPRPETPSPPSEGPLEGSAEWRRWKAKRPL